MEAIITLVLQLLIPIVVASVVGLIWKSIGAEGMRKVESELGTKSEYVKIAVRLIEQAYKDLKGKEKADKALAWAVARLNEKGVKFTEAELRGLIESSVRQLKDEFPEQWESAKGKELATGATGGTVVQDVFDKIKEKSVRIESTDITGLTPEKVEELAQKLKLTNYRYTNISE